MMKTPNLTIAMLILQNASLLPVSRASASENNSIILHSSASESSTLSQSNSESENAINLQLLLINYVDHEKLSALTSLLSDPEKVEKLDFKKVNKTFFSGPEGFTILTRAVETGNPKIVEAILKAAPDHPDLQKLKNGTTPLMIAAKLGHLEIAQLLLKYGANPTQTDNEGRTPYYYSNISYRSLIQKAREKEDTTPLLAENNEKLNNNPESNNQDEASAYKPNQDPPNKIGDLLKQAISQRNRDITAGKIQGKIVNPNLAESGILKRREKSPDFKMIPIPKTGEGLQNRDYPKPPGYSTYSSDLQIPAFKASAKPSSTEQPPPLSPQTQSQSPSVATSAPTSSRIQKFQQNLKVFIAPISKAKSQANTLVPRSPKSSDSNSQPGPGKL